MKKYTCTGTKGTANEHDFGRAKKINGYKVCPICDCFAIYR